MILFSGAFFIMAAAIIRTVLLLRVSNPHMRESFFNYCASKVQGLTTLSLGRP